MLHIFDSTVSESLNEPERSGTPFTVSFFYCLFGSWIVTLPIYLLNDNYVRTNTVTELLVLSTIVGIAVGILAKIETNV